VTRLARRAARPPRRALRRPRGRLRDGVVAWLLLAAAAGCESPANSAHPSSGPPAINVEIAPVVETGIRDTVALVGQLEAEESVVLKPETAAVVQEVFFEDGDRVRTGQVLLQMRDGEERAHLREAAARLTLAEDEYARTKQLAAKNTVSAAELDRANRHRRGGAGAARPGGGRARSDDDPGAVRRGAGRPRGVARDRVSKSTALVRIDAVDRLRLRFTVPELAVTAMRVGSPVVVSVAPFPASTSPAKCTSSRRRSTRRAGGCSSRRGSPTPTAVCGPASSRTSCSRWRGATTHSSFPSRRSRTTPTACSSGASARARPPSGSR
jgi:multidrug efflux pump subunit AcrA (membrane-fusion protein)